MLRELFVALCLDVDNYGSSRWNPLSRWVRPGHTVVIKPNFVSHRNHSGHSIYSVITHPSVIRAIVDYTFIALHGKGRIIIADSPEMYCSWTKLIEQVRLEALLDFYKREFDFQIEIIDLRDFEVIESSDPQFSQSREALAGDPSGSVVVNLAGHSHFAGLPSENFYGADYDRKATISRHHDSVQEYLVSKTILTADFIIFIPKMKTHKKVGVTLNLKGLVGTVTDKNCLIHYRLGSPRFSGDQLPDDVPTVDRSLLRLRSWLFDQTLSRQDRWGDLFYKVAGFMYRHSVGRLIKLQSSTIAQDGGNWYGNDSAWRMVADLAKIIYFASDTGKLQNESARRFLSVVDGIIAGEGNGPLAPSAKFCGCLVAGDDLVAVDLVTSQLMGIDPSRLRQFEVAADKEWPFRVRSPADVFVSVNGKQLLGEELMNPCADIPRFRFRPPDGWSGAIEWE